jgi:hypothetical protein
MDEAPQICLEALVQAFRLAIGLRMLSRVATELHTG